MHNIKLPIKMNDNDIFYFLALLSVEGIGDINARKLIRHCGSARQVLKERTEVLQKIKGVGPHILNKLKNPKIFEKAASEMKFMETNKIEAISYLDDLYPEKLKHCMDAPLTLFKKGNFKMNKQRIISIVGTRRMTSYGMGFLKEFIGEIKKYNPIIVSGLAYGIDVFAHQEALNNNLSTIGILAHGLDRIYPKAHAQIARSMLDYGGFYTEFWSGTNPDKENFVKRNRIVAGISEATIIVESARKGGSLITAELANSYNRDVFAVPGRTSDMFSTGCNLLIKSHKAAMITSVKDLEFILNWDTKEAKVKNIQRSLFVELTKEEQGVYDYLGTMDKQLLDLMAIDCNLSIQKIVIILLQLELKGLVQSLAGKWYKAVK